MNRRAIMAAALVAAAIIVAYGGIAAGLVRQWHADENYSHGFIVAPLAAWFAWERRARLRALDARPSAAGLLLIVASLGLLMLGVLGAELFLSRISLVGVLAGIVLFLFGRAHLRVLAFPIAFLLLMIPLPAIVFNQIALPLQMFASQAGAATLDLAGVPVLREGNILELPTTRLEVAEACSGIRSLISLLTLAIVLGHFSLARRRSRVALALASIPVAIVANATRVAGTGLAAHYWSPELAEGFFHSFSGWIVFAVAFTALLGIQWLLARTEESRQSNDAAPVLANA